MDENAERKQICESCGADFGCGARAEKCWCFEIDLPSATLFELSRNYDKCLCPKCLEKLSKGDANELLQPAAK